MSTLIKAVYAHIMTFKTETCNLIISASTRTLLTWSQLQTALDMLINLCVEHPLKTPQGGRAYYQVQPQLSGRRKRNDLITALNAIPPDVNMTIMAHNLAASLSCEWEAAQRGQAVSACA